MGDEKLPTVSVSKPIRILLGVIIGLAGFFFLVLSIFVIGLTPEEPRSLLLTVAGVLFPVLFAGVLLYMAFRLITKKPEERLFPPVVARVFAGVFGVGGIAALIVAFFNPEGFPTDDIGGLVITEQTVREKIANAKATAGDVLREWEVRSETDAASGEKVPRYASVVSDSGLCRLAVEQRIDGSALAGIYCSGLKISPYKDIEVKFDNRPMSDTMRIKKFSDGDNVYISSYQYDYSGHLSYNEFLRRLARANRTSLLLTVEGADQHWITFSLRGSSSALTKIGVLYRRK